jgi:glutathione synthase/RimK-type ligase-like ATP-grasp enzyme
LNNIIVVSSLAKSVIKESLGSNNQILTAEEYLKNDYELSTNARVINLSDDYNYCKKGYYVSLLAEARKQKPLPSVSTISDLQNKDAFKLVAEAINLSLNKALRDIKADEFEISLYFGKNLAEKYSYLAKTIFSYFRVPLLRVYCLKKHDVWSIRSIRSISFKEIPDTHYEFLFEKMNDYLKSSHSNKKPKGPSEKYDLAILINPDEELPPSNLGAIKSFVKAAKDLRINAEIIGPKEISSINQFDALFIRETTNVFDHTYKFAKRAELEGLVVMDDPQSILRCCNKVYLHDFLVKKKLSTPETWIIYKNTDLSHFTKFPLIIKKPDSAFSEGVKKVNSLEELNVQAQEYFLKSDLLVIQEFLQTDFDWRIGVIDNEPIYACRYHMASNHWQIIKREGNKAVEGVVDTLAVDEAPKKAIQLALKACKEIGNGLYGVDIKEKDGNFYIIEVNDNPSIEKGSEDRVLGQQLYHKIMSTFLRRLEAR